MIRPVRLFARLYPKPWRDRYGEEFEALLDEAGTNGGAAANVLMGAILMQFQRWQKAWVGGGALVTLCLFVAAWWNARKPYNTPGTHQVFHMDSNPGALLEFLVILSLFVIGPITLIARRKRWIGPCIAASYLVGTILVSLAAPEKIVSVGDSYCWDLWCMGIEKVSAAPKGENTEYRAEVSLFVDSTTAQLDLTGQSNQFFYAVDEQGRRFPIVTHWQGSDRDSVVKPGEPVKFLLTFFAPAGARNLYVMGDIRAPWWVRIYFGSDLNPFHRRTLLRIV